MSKKVKKRTIRARKTDAEVRSILAEVKKLAYGEQGAWLKKNKLTTSHLAKWKQRIEAKAEIKVTKKAKKAA